VEFFKSPAGKWTATKSKKTNKKTKNK
jgi:hypothetical protein